MAQETIKVNKAMFEEKWQNKGGVITHPDVEGTFKLVKEMKDDVLLVENKKAE